MLHCNFGIGRKADCVPAGLATGLTAAVMRGHNLAARQGTVAQARTVPPRPRAHRPAQASHSSWAMKAPASAAGQPRAGSATFSSRRSLSSLQTLPNITVQLLLSRKTRYNLCRRNGCLQELVALRTRTRCVCTACLWCKNSAAGEPTIMAFCVALPLPCTDCSSTLTQYRPRTCRK